MLIPASGPMPGSIPTSVPVTQPRNAYHNTSGRNATEKPSSRLSKVASTARLKSKQAVRERGFEQRPEQEIREYRHTNAESGRRQKGSTFHHDEKRKQQQTHGDDKAEQRVQRDTGGCQHNHLNRMRQVGPRHGRDRWALARPRHQDKAERNH